MASNGEDFAHRKKTVEKFGQKDERKDQGRNKILNEGPHRGMPSSVEFSWHKNPRNKFISKKPRNELSEAPILWKT